jgi:hypothetical protein
MPTVRQIAARAASKPSKIPACAIPSPSLTCDTPEWQAAPATPTIQIRSHVLGFVPLFFANPRSSRHRWMPRKVLSALPLHLHVEEPDSSVPLLSFRPQPQQSKTTSASLASFRYFSQIRKPTALRRPKCLAESPPRGLSDSASPPRWTSLLEPNPPQAES